MEALIFLIIIEAIGLLTFPLVAFLFKGLKDYGYSISKQFGVVIITYIAWILSSLKLLKFDFSIIFALLLLAVFSLLALKYNRIKFKEEIVVQEVIFILTFLASVTYIVFKPEIYFAYSEDFMDFAFLKSILRSDYFPPQDPWFAGENLSYYYFGHLITAILIKISGIKAEVGYNLAVAMFFSMAVQSAFGIGYNLTGKKLYGFITVVLICFMGFLSGLLQLLAYVTGMEILNYKPFNGGFIDWLLSFDFCAANWIIPHAITFYPFFTFIQGDLHAHFMSIPFQLAFIGACFAVYQRFSLTSFTSALIFSLFFIGLNTWDFPAYFILLITTAYLSTRKRLFLVFITAITIVFLYSLLNGNIGVVDERTSIIEYTQIFAVFTFITLAYLQKISRIKPKIAIAFLIITVAGFLLGIQLMFLTVLLILFLFSRAGREEKYPVILAIMAMLLILFCELFYINDALGRPYERMNTIMKIYLEVWILWGVASAFFMSKIKNKAILAISIILIAILLIHPIASSISMPNKVFMGKTEELTLDGMKWLEESKPEEYKAIKWLENRTGIVLEAPGSAYSYSSRVSTFTGLPTVIGWQTHEIMWGRSWDAVNERIKDVDSIYLNASKDLVDKYGIKYIFVGEVERKRYGNLKLDRCDWLREVYRDGNVVIYEVVKK